MTEDKKSFPMTVNPVSDLDICRHVRNLMRKRHVMPEDCAEHIGADVDEFIGWLEGIGTIPPSYLVPLAEFLGVSVAALLIPDEVRGGLLPAGPSPHAPSAPIRVPCSGGLA